MCAVSLWRSCFWLSSSSACRTKKVRWAMCGCSGHVYDLQGEAAAIGSLQRGPQHRILLSCSLRVCCVGATPHWDVGRHW